MGKKERLRPLKPCDNCGAEADVQYRIRSNNSESWQIVCKACQEKAKTLTGYIYGGTWKRKKRN